MNKLTVVFKGGPLDGGTTQMPAVCGAVPYLLARMHPLELVIETCFRQRWGPPLTRDATAGRVKTSPHIEDSGFGVHEIAAGWDPYRLIAANEEFDHLTYKWMKWNRP